MRPRTSYKALLLEECILIFELSWTAVTFFNRLSSDKALNAAFMKMQEIYVFDERDKVEHEKLIEKIGILHEVLLNLDEGLR